MPQRNLVLLVLKRIFYWSWLFVHCCSKLHWRDWPGFAPLDNWFPYRWETGEVFDSPESHLMRSWKCPLHVDYPIVGILPPAHAVCVIVDRLFYVEHVQVKVLVSFGTPASASRAVGSDLHEDDPAQYPKDHDATMIGTLLMCYIICELCCSTNVAVQEMGINSSAGRCRIWMHWHFPFYTFGKTAALECCMSWRRL